MTDADTHRLKIARATLRISDIMIPVMGGMTKDEAVRIVREAEEKARKARNARARARHAAYTDCGMRRTPWGWE